MSESYNIRWGILATGWIAEMFVTDLLKDPSTRSVSDVSHTVVAVASSSSKDRATKFIQDFKVPSPCAAYGSYSELVADPNVDVIYVATPHSHHYQNSMLALNAGKHVLCEKAFTVNAEQAKILVKTAKDKNLFLMEAVWTRYFPLSAQVRKLISDGEIGEVVRVIADNSFADDVEKKYGTKHRMVNMDLAGGALLDLGIYSLTWLFQTLYHTLPATIRKPPTVTSTMTKYPDTGADESTTILLTFPHSTPSNLFRQSQAIGMTCLRVASNPGNTESFHAAIKIQGTKGEIQVVGPAFRPTGYRVIYNSEEGKEAKETKEVHVDIPGTGFIYEADEVARCLRDGKLESQGLSWEESVIIMEVMDEVRKQNGLVYPEKIETTKYPVEL